MNQISRLVETSAKTMLQLVIAEIPNAVLPTFIMSQPVDVDASNEEKELALQSCGALLTEFTFKNFNYRPYESEDED